MTSPLQLSLEELPDAESLEQEKQAIQDRLAEQGSRIGKLHWTLTRDTALAGLHNCLGQLDAFEWLCKGWCTTSELRQIAKQTAADPSSEKALPLAKHPLTVVVHPVVTIHCDPIVLPSLRFTLKLEAMVDCAVLIVRGGRLAAIEAAKLTPSATLSYENAKLKTFKYDPIEIGRSYNLPNGGLAIAH